MSDSEEDASLERQVKISLVGEPSAGKSMLCARYLGFQLNAPAAPTQGAEVLLGECPVRPSKPPVPIKFCDVAGNSCNTTMLSNYLYMSDIVVFVYDVTNLQSFERLGKWLHNVSKIFPDDETKPLYATFGNKCDMEHQRAVRLSCIQSFTEQNGLASFIGSARTGENINSTIISLVSEYLGIPVNRSLFHNAVIKAELSTYVKHQPPKKKASNKGREPPREAAAKNKDANPDGKENGRRTNNKILKSLKRKPPSAVFIEKYTDNVRFCIICNYLSKIIPALQSRCTRFRFAPLQPDQIVPRVEDIIKKEGITVSEDGLKALLTLSGGDMRKVLNTLQSTWMAYKNVTEENVYTCVGHPLKRDIENIVKWLLNEDDFGTCYQKIKDLKTAKGLALQDVLTEVHNYVHRIELPDKVLIMLLIKMSDLEIRLAAGCNENIQLVSLISCFQQARDMIEA